jgi:hypothetical protein
LSLAKGCSRGRGRPCESPAPSGPLRGARQPAHLSEESNFLLTDAQTCGSLSVLAEFSHGIPPRRHAEYGRALVFAVTPHVSSRDRRGSANERRARGKGARHYSRCRGRHNPLKRLKTAKEKKGNPRESKGNPRQFQGKTKECRGIPRKSKSIAPALRRSVDRRRFIHGDRPKGGPNSRRRRPLTPGFAWSGGGRAGDRVRSE